MCQFKNELEAKISYSGREINLTICDLLSKANYQSLIKKYIKRIKFSYSNMDDRICAVTAIASAVLFQADFLEDDNKANFLYNCYRDILAYTERALPDKFYILADYLNLRYWQFKYRGNQIWR